MAEDFVTVKVAVPVGHVVICMYIISIITAARAGRLIKQAQGCSFWCLSVQMHGDFSFFMASGVGGDRTTSQQQPSSKQSAAASSTLHGLLDNVIKK